MLCRQISQHLRPASEYLFAFCINTEKLIIDLREIDCPLPERFDLAADHAPFSFITDSDENVPFTGSVRKCHSQMCLLRAHRAGDPDCSGPRL